MNHSGNQRLPQMGMSDTFPPQTHQATPHLLHPLGTQRLVQGAFHCKGCVMAHFGAQHSFFIDEMYHHRDEHAIYEEIAGQPLVLPPALPNYAFRPLVPTETIPPPPAFQTPQIRVTKLDGNPQLQVPGVLSGAVEARQYSPVSDDDWARASIDYEALSPESVETNADSPLTPGTDGATGKLFTDYVLNEGSHANNTLALAFARKQGFDAKPSESIPLQSAHSAQSQFPFGTQLPVHSTYRSNELRYAGTDHTGGLDQAAQAGTMPGHMFASSSMGGSFSSRTMSEEDATSEYGSSDRRSTSTGGLDSDRAMSINARHQLLLDLRAKNVSYRKIKATGHFPEAESTLRGIHRALTKPKEERVRKPEWTRGDLQLLRRAVAHHAPANPRARVSMPWKKVGEWMVEHGSSYRFGPSTIAKQWEKMTS